MSHGACNQVIGESVSKLLHRKEFVPFKRLSGTGISGTGNQCLNYCIASKIFLSIATLCQHQRPRSDSRRSSPAADPSFSKLVPVYLSPVSPLALRALPIFLLVFRVFASHYNNIGPPASFGREENGSRRTRRRETAGNGTKLPIPNPQYPIPNTEHPIPNNLHPNPTKETLHDHHGRRYLIPTNRNAA